MINGVHAIVFTKNPEGVRAFFRDVLGLASVDAGGGWPIFALPLLLMTTSWPTLSLP